MTNPIEVTDRKPLRVWPALAIVGLQIAGIALAPVFFEDAMIAGIGAVVGGALLIVLWWLFFSRAPWLERIGAVILMVALAMVVKPASDISIAGAGQGFLVYIMSAPLLAFGLVLWAIGTRRLNTAARRAALVAALVIACTPMLLIRTDGVGGPNPFHWRWTPTAEEILLAQGEEPVTAPPPVLAPTEPAKIESSPAPVEKKTDTSKVAAAPGPMAPVAPIAPVARTWPRAEWPGFRGPLRDGIVRNVRINTDWTAAPPASRC